MIHIIYSLQCCILFPFNKFYQYSNDFLLIRSYCKLTDILFVLLSSINTHHMDTLPSFYFILHFALYSFLFPPHLISYLMVFFCFALLQCLLVQWLLLFVNLPATKNCLHMKFVCRSEISCLFLLCSFLAFVSYQLKRLLCVVECSVSLQCVCFNCFSFSLSLSRTFLPRLMANVRKYMSACMFSNVYRSISTVCDFLFLFQMFVDVHISLRLAKLLGKVVLCFFLLLLDWSNSQVNV